MRSSFRAATNSSCEPWEARAAGQLDMHSLAIIATIPDLASLLACLPASSAVLWTDQLMTWTVVPYEN